MTVTRKITYNHLSPALNSRQTIPLYTEEKKLINIFPFLRYPTPFFHISLLRGRENGEV